MKLSKKPYKGCRDFYPEQMRLRNYLFQKMKEVSESFGFEPYDGPLLEEVELYKAKSGEELINEQIYSFYDRGERHVAIRPEMTPTVARMVAAVHREVAKPIRWYSIPNLMRYERPQRGRLREHWQFNVDIFGSPQSLGEVEVISLIHQLMKSFGANSSMYAILINDRSVVDSFFTQVLKLDSQTSYRLYKLIDKSKKISPEKLHEEALELLGDESKVKLFNSYLSLNSFEELQSFVKSHGIEEHVASFMEFINLTQKLDVAEVLQYDPSIVRGLDYYTGVVFEVFDKHPDNRRAIAGGGAYANLLQIFDEAPLPGVGLGMGDVTLSDFLATHKIMPDFSKPDHDLLFCYFEDDCVISALQTCNALRALGLKVEFHPGAVKFNKVFKLAEKKNFRYVTMFGKSELEANEVAVKDLETKEQKNFKLDNPQGIFDYIRK